MLTVRHQCEAMTRWQPGDNLVSEEFWFLRCWVRDFCELRFVALNIAWKDTPPVVHNTSMTYAGNPSRNA